MSDFRSGQTIRNSGITLKSVRGGCFYMGANHGNSDEYPIHPVCINNFWLGQTEVTQGQWQAIMGNNPSYFKNGSNYPVENLNWKDVQTFIHKLNSMVFLK